MEDILDDLCARFLLNVPEDDLSSFERICFQIEQAHWFYEDFYREQDPSLPGFSFQRFVSAMFNHCPILTPHAHLAGEIVHRFKTYKGRVPVCGAILLNPEMDKVLLVRGYTAKSSWSFPRGKINQDESEVKCAIREVFEETSYDIGEGIQEKQYLEIYLKEQRIRLFLIRDVPEDYPFAPRTRKEIGKIEWHPVASLPKSSGGRSAGGYSYFNVAPFSRNIIKWIKKHGKEPVAAASSVASSSSAAAATALETNYYKSSNNMASTSKNNNAAAAAARIFSDSDVPNPEVKKSTRKKDTISSTSTASPSSSSRQQKKATGSSAVITPKKQQQTMILKRPPPSIISSSSEWPDIIAFTDFSFDIKSIMTVFKNSLAAEL